MNSSKLSVYIKAWSGLLVEGKAIPPLVAMEAGAL